MSQLTKRIARLEGPGNGDEIVTIETHDGDFVTTHTELKYMLREYRRQNPWLAEQG